MNPIPFLFLLSAALFPLCSAAKSRKSENRNTIRIDASDTRDDIRRKAIHVVPTANQLASLERGYIAFVHFGPNTFSRREWGTGLEDPKVFNPKDIDTDQWVKAMKDAGMRMVVLTAKHHDGFVLWQSRYTDHGIMSSPYIGGKGDVMKSLSESCRKYGLKLGVYLSPADLYQIESPDGLYGNLSPKTTRVIPKPVEGRPFSDPRTFTFEGIDDYNEYFLSQLFELLTEYGPIDEVWFDGAHPKRKGGQTYNYKAWRELIRELAPTASIFGREDLRWCGNEAGRTRDTEWNVIGYQTNPDTATVFHDMTGYDLGSIGKLSESQFIHYQPAEVDTSIRNGWFYRNDDEQKSRSADDVFDIYERSVGGNAILILNVPPNREGRLTDRDVSALRESGKMILDTYGSDLMSASDRNRKLGDNDIHSFIKISKPLVVRFDSPVKINRLSLSEPVADKGERIESVRLETYSAGRWKPVAEATNVGYRRILRFPATVTDRIRLTVTCSRATPHLAEISAHCHEETAEVGRADSGIKYYPKDKIKVTARSGDASAINDSDPATFWEAQIGEDAYIIMDLGSAVPIRGIVYVPQTAVRGKGMVDRGRISASENGKDWTEIGVFEFGNLINDPTPRRYGFERLTKARYLRVEPLSAAGDDGTAAIAEISIF